MSDDNTIDLDLSIAEQIATAQLVIIRDAAFMRPLSLEEVRILEILVKTKNVEEERRKPKNTEDSDAKRLSMLKQLAQTSPDNLIDFTEKKKNEPRKTRTRRKKSD
jgi:hypothetical protein